MSTIVYNAICALHWDDVSSLLMFSWAFAAGMKEPKQIDWIGSCQPPLQMICNMSSIFCQLIWSNSNKKVILLHFNIVDEIGSTRSTGAWPKSMWDPNKILTSVWRLKCIWGPLAFSIYRLSSFAENVVTHTDTEVSTNPLDVCLKAQITSMYDI